MRPQSPVLPLALLLLTASTAAAASGPAARLSPVPRPAPTASPALSLVKNLKPFVHILTPAEGHALLIGDACTVSWQGVGITGVIMDLIFEAVPASPGHPAQFPRAVALGTAPGASGKTLVHLTQAHAAIAPVTGALGQQGWTPVDGTATLRIRGTTADGGTVEDRRPVSLLVPAVALAVPVTGATLKVGAPVTLRWSCPRTKPDKVAVVVGYSAMSLGTLTSWQKEVPNTGLAQVVIPASALHAGSKPEDYRVGVRLVFPSDVYQAGVRDHHDVILKP